MSDLARQALTLLESVRGRPLTQAQRAQHSVQLATLLHGMMQQLSSRKERRRDEQLARMMNDQPGQAFTTALTDRAYRSSDPRRALDQASYLLERLGPPAYLSALEQFGLGALKAVGALAPNLSAGAMLQRIRQETSDYILPAAKDELKQYLRRRSQQNCQVNVNNLGEEVLSEAEAERRVQTYIELLRRPEVSTISVKISSIFSQIDVLAFEQSVTKICERLQPIYEAALASPVSKTTPGAKGATGKLVYLDMEAYRDLQLTAEAFRRTLSQPAFQQLTAGMALQAYLPDSYAMQQELTRWAEARVGQGGAPIRLRLVKGANLAMETVEASLRGWPLPIYPSKLDVDANFKRMLNHACTPERARAVTLGVATHNLFDVAYTLITSRSTQTPLELELLEGMAEALRQTLLQLDSQVLVYAPIVDESGFASAVAYLVRRLDENTAPENFLRHSFGMRVGDSEWKQQKRVFCDACDRIDSVSSSVRRTQDRALDRTQEPRALPGDAAFDNEPDTDFTLPANRSALLAWVTKLQDANFSVSSQIPGADADLARVSVKGIDPSRPNANTYDIILANEQDVQQALANAEAALPAWQARPHEERIALVQAAAHELRRHRCELIATMLLDAGKRLEESDTEVSEAIDFAEYYSRSWRALYQRADVKLSARGPCVVTPPWNFPLAIPLGGVFAALVSGNSCILKPALETPLVAQRAAQLCWQAGLPKDVLQLVVCEDSEASALIQDERVKTVVLTGATSTAKLFFQMRPDLHLLAETGGKNAMYISPMSDRQAAIKDALASAFGHSGQKCSALSLLILHQELYDDPAFLKELKEAAQSLKVGSAWDIENKLTPLIQPASDLQRRALTQLEEGESWLLEPDIDSDNPRIVSPGIKLGVQPGSFAHQTEFFCPHISLMRARDLEHALQLANGTSYGLTSGIHSLDEREQQRWLDGVQAGNVYVNRKITGAVVRRQAFGGWKSSSFGPGAKAGGPNYVAQFIHVEDVRPVLQAVPKTTSIPADASAPSSMGAGHARQLRDKHPKLYRVIESLPQAERRLLYELHKAYLNRFGSCFAKPIDESEIVGEDNHLRYAPLQAVLVVADAHNKRRELLLSLVAAAVCGTPAVGCALSSQTQAPSELDEVARALGLWSYSDADSLLRCLERAHAEANIERIRFLGTPDIQFLERAHELGLHVARQPLVREGRFELLNYLKEQSQSVCYHRYGNLGLRGLQRSQ